MKKLHRTLLIAAAVAGTAGPALAQFQKPEDAIRYRQSVLFTMGQHFGRIGAMANGRVPLDAKAASENAELVAQFARLPWAGFAAGTDKGNTKARPEIWSDSAKFKEAADKMTAEAAKLAAVTRGGDLEAIKAAFGATGASCKACHDTFRTQ